MRKNESKKPKGQTSRSTGTTVSFIRTAVVDYIRDNFIHIILLCVVSVASYILGAYRYNINLIDTVNGHDGSIEQLEEIAANQEELNKRYEEMHLQYSASIESIDDKLELQQQSINLILDNLL